MNENFEEAHGEVMALAREIERLRLQLRDSLQAEEHAQKQWDTVERDNERLRGLLRDVIADDEASLARGDYGIANGLRLSIDAALAGTADQPSVPQAAKGKSFDQFRAECQEYARRTDPTDGAT